MSVVLGLLVGLVLGLTGAGGSVFAVPLLVFGLGWTPLQAAPVALIAVCVAAAFGTVVAWDLSFVRYRAALLMSFVGLFTAPLGLLLGLHLPAPALGVLFAGVLVVVATRMWLQARRHPQDARVVRATVHSESADDARGGPLCRSSVDSGRLLWTPRCASAIVGIGAGSGFLSGLLGVGGGFVIVPALRATTTLSVHSAVATSLMAIALTSAGTVATMLAFGRPLPWLVALPFVAGALGGMLAGRRLAPRLAGPLMQQCFAVLMLIAAFALLTRT